MKPSLLLLSLALALSPSCATVGGSDPYDAFPGGREFPIFPVVADNALFPEA